MKLFIVSTVALLATGTNAFAPPYKSASISISTSTSLDLFDGKKGSGNKGGLVNQFSIFRKNKQVLGMESVTQGEVAGSKTEAPFVIGRIAAFLTSLVSLAVIPVGMLAISIKTFVFGFVPAPISKILTPVAWIAALAPLYFLPFPLSIILYLVCPVLSFTGIPPYANEEQGALAKFAVVEEEDEEESIISKFILGPAKSIFLLFLAFTEAVIGLSPVAENKGFFWDRLFAKKSQIFPPSENALKGKKFPKEKWIYINGVNVLEAEARAEAEMMYSIFGRPVTAVHNPSDGVILDILECIAGKVNLFKFGEIEPRKMLIEYLKKSLQEAKASGMEKVVLIAHSQGTIIAGNALRFLGEDDEVKGLMKELLEVHILAGCSHTMPGENVKYLENMSNRFDVISWLGHLFPDPLKSFWYNTRLEGVDYSEGESFIEEKEWGHLLDQHFLIPIRDDGKFSSSKLVKEYLKDGKQN